MGRISGVESSASCTYNMDGAAFYYAWLSVPCVSSKNDEVIPTNSLYV
uniref:Uncharacterized protein n=1 Tax=Peronospora matthiolae TaxID=2874970 RepID=A0AAV1UIS9_9STRA